MQDLYSIGISRGWKITEARLPKNIVLRVQQYFRALRKVLSTFTKNLNLQYENFYYIMKQLLGFSLISVCL
jgi:hypothetical protein